MARHPLERFLSSYRDKIELENSSYYFHSLFGEPDYEVGQYPDPPTHLSSQMDFPTFVARMLATPVESWDWHWIPIHLLCPPCAGFHVIGRMETFSEDAQYIIARAGLADILKDVKQQNRKREGSLFQLHLSYFCQLSRSQLDQLVDIYRFTMNILCTVSIFMDHMYMTSFFLQERLSVVWV